MRTLKTALALVRMTTRPTKRQDAIPTRVPAEPQVHSCSRRAWIRRRVRQVMVQPRTNLPILVLVLALIPRARVTPSWA